MQPAAVAETSNQASLDVKKTVPWIIFLIFFSVLNETVFNVSTPAIAQQYRLSPIGVSWIITTFIIFFGIGSVIYGRLSDIYSLRKLIVIGILIYNAGSILGFALQHYYPAVIVARAIQGAGSAAIPALIMVVVARYFSPSDRGKVFGLITSTVSFAIGVGPVLGGFISGTYHWTFLFLIPLFTLISIPFFRAVLPHEQKKEGKVDVPGASLIGLGVAVLILFFTFPIWYLLVISLVLLSWFVIHIRRSSNPFIEPALFSKPLFRNGLIIGFIISCTVMGIMFVTPLMLDAVNGLSTNQIGWILFPGAISAVVFGTIGGNLADKKGNNYVIYIGLALLLASLLVSSLLIGRSPWFLSAALLPTYIGFSFVQTALVNRVSLTLEQHETGVGMGLFNLISFISGAVGAALVAKILAGNWLDFKLYPLLSQKAYAYSNLFLLFGAAVILGGLLYIRSFSRKRVS